MERADEDLYRMPGRAAQLPKRCWASAACGGIVTLVLITVAWAWQPTSVTSVSLSEDSQKSELEDRLAKLIAETKLLNASAASANATAKTTAKPSLRAGATEASGKVKNALGIPKVDNETLWNDPLSLFCFAVVVEAEMPLIRWQHGHQAGIFGCSTWAVYSNGKDPMLIGRQPDGSLVHTTPIPGPNALVGQAYFFGCSKPQKYIMNANVMTRAWEKIVAERTAGLHSWIIKVDPDTAFSPGRLQRLISREALDSPDEMPGRYFKNCLVMNSMQGSIEILSRNAFYIYTGRKKQCQQKMDWWHMGEDIFTFKCLQQLKIPAHNFPEVVHDSYCAKTSGCVSAPGVPNCSSPHVAAFHPLKKVHQFNSCWSEMERVEARAAKMRRVSI